MSRPDARNPYLTGVLPSQVVNTAARRRQRDERSPA